MRLIILCAGRQTRWKRSLKQKYLVPIGDEPLLHNTIRRFRIGTPDLDIVVVLHPDAPDIERDDVGVFRPPRDQLCDEHKITSSLPVWAPDHNILVFGDVFFTDAAIYKILANDADEIIWFGRPGASALTGSKYQEIFGLSFPTTHAVRLVKAAQRIRTAFRMRRLSRAKAWEVYWLVNGYPPYRVSPGGRIRLPKPGVNIERNFVVIDDLTDDFDTPVEYMNWLKAAREHGMLT
jgi:hypothetical protein